MLARISADPFIPFTVQRITVVPEPFTEIESENTARNCHISMSRTSDFLEVNVLSVFFEQSRNGFPRILILIDLAMKERNFVAAYRSDFPVHIEPQTEGAVFVPLLPDCADPEV